MSFIDSISTADESVSAIMQAYPEQATALMELTENIMRTGECAFSAKQRELIAAFSSGVNSCTYCYESHRAAAEAFGIDQQLLGAALADIDSSHVNENMKPVLHYVRKLTLFPTRMTQADADAIFNAGWKERDFHFTVMICSVFNLYNRIIEGYGVKNTSTYRLKSGAALAAEGYFPPD
jgi:uncharacterized peroxidase-related enzyme